MGASRSEIQRSWQNSSTKKFVEASGELAVELGRLLVVLTKEFGPPLVNALFGSSKAKKHDPPAAPPLPAVTLPPPEEWLYRWQYRPVWRWYVHRFEYNNRLNHPSVKNQEAWCGVCGYRRYHAIHSVEAVQERLI